MVNRELEEPRPAVSQRALILLLLYFLNTLLVLDKIILSVLLEPIKAEFSLNDSQLGLLTGAAYALCLGVASIPFGIAVDRTNRRNLASACLAVWSGMTALFLDLDLGHLRVQSTLELLLLRVLLVGCKTMV